MQRLRSQRKNEGVNVVDGDSIWPPGHTLSRVEMPHEFSIRKQVESRYTNAII